MHPIAKWHQKNKNKPPTPSITNERLPLVHEYLADGYTVSAACRMAGISTRAYYYHKNKEKK